jgi:hypothetical protein
MPDANIHVGSVTVEIGTSGPQGPQGPQGPEAPIATLSYVHEQVSASTTWSINHNLTFIPNVIVVDSNNEVVEGSYSYPSSTSVVLSFSIPISGKAFLS